MHADKIQEKHTQSNLSTVSEPSEMMPKSGRPNLSAAQIIVQL